MSFRVYTHEFVCSLLRYRLNVFFPPTSLSRMPKVFFLRFCTFWKILLIKGVKLLLKKFTFGANFTLLSIIFWAFLFHTPFNGLFPPLSKVQCANFLDCLNPWRKVMKRSGLRFEKGVKLPQKKKFCTIFFIFICLLRLNVFFPPLPKVLCPNF